MNQTVSNRISNNVCYGMSQVLCGTTTCQTRKSTSRAIRAAILSDSDMNFEKMSAHMIWQCDPTTYIDLKHLVTWKVNDTKLTLKLADGDEGYIFTQLTKKPSK